MVHSGDVAAEMSMLVPHTAPEQRQLATRVQHSLAVPRHKTKQPIRRVAANCFMNLSYISISEPQIPWQGGRFSVRNPSGAVLCTRQIHRTEGYAARAQSKKQRESISKPSSREILNPIPSAMCWHVVPNCAIVCVCVCEALFIGSFVT